MTRGNIIGEDLKPFLVKEIKNRQEIHGSGYQGLRSMEQLQYLTNKNAWFKMASSVIIFDKDKLVNEKFKKLGKKIEGFGLSEENSYLGVIYDLNKNKGEPKRSTFDLYKEDGVDSGGLNTYGYVPPPGIESFEVKTRNRGSIRTGVVKMKAFSKAQFDVIDFLYFRPGFSVMLEWGWDIQFIDGKIKEQDRKTILDDFWFRSDSGNTTHLEMMEKINFLREYFDGNYDGFFGKINNFEWTLGSDGIYDITISLVTMGDVIESLNLNIAPQYAILRKESIAVDDTTTEGGDSEGGTKPDFTISGNGKFLADSNLVKGASSNQLCNILFQSINENKYNNSEDYYSLKDSIDIGFLNRAIDDRYNYYVTFSELMWLIEYHLIPSITNDVDNPIAVEKLIKFDENVILSDESEIYISLYPNQIALDPSICIFEHKANIGYNNITEGGLSFVALGLSETSDSGVNKNKQFLQTLNNNENVKYGKLSNLFINFDFISKCLLEKTDQKGDMNLFSFLKTLCDGINKSLGNVNKIEPVIKDDKIITFIDQSVIPGYSKIRQSFGMDKEDYLINLWGYNNTGETVTSNFIKDFSFKTQIKPEMASQISIGATANGSKTSTINGTIFENWNAGLKDKFNQYSLNPSPYMSMESPESKIIKRALSSIAGYKMLESADVTYAKYTDAQRGGRSATKETLFDRMFNPSGYNESNVVAVKGKDGKEDIIVNREDSINRNRKIIMDTINNINTSFINNDYGSYLIEAFGGDATSYINTKDLLEKAGIKDVDKALNEKEIIDEKIRVEKERDEIGKRAVIKASKFDDVGKGF